MCPGGDLLRGEHQLFPDSSEGDSSPPHHEPGAGQEHEAATHHPPKKQKISVHPPLPGSQEAAGDVQLLPAGRGPGPPIPGLSLHRRFLTPNQEVRTPPSPFLSRFFHNY